MWCGGYKISHPNSQEGSKSGLKMFIEVAKCLSNQIKKSLFVFAEKSTSK